MLQLVLARPFRSGPVLEYDHDSNDGQMLSGGVKREAEFDKSEAGPHKEAEPNSEGSARSGVGEEGGVGGMEGGGGSGRGERTKEKKRRGRKGCGTGSGCGSGWASPSLMSSVSRRAAGAAWFELSVI